jgi:hypothetical protein
MKKDSRYEILEHKILITLIQINVTCEGGKNFTVRTLDGSLAHMGDLSIDSVIILK